jgi:hypothetical protein
VNSSSLAMDSAIEEVNEDEGEIEKRLWRICSCILSFFF